MSLLAKYCQKKKNGVYCCYKHCSKLFSKMKRETEFRQHHCRNCKKRYEREEN